MNVENFGAVPGGTANCAAAFTAAFSSSETSIEVPHGKTYLVDTSSKITIPAGNRLIGGGTVKCAGSASAFGLDSGAVVDGVRFIAPAGYEQSPILITANTTNTVVSSCEFVFLDEGAVGISAEEGASEALIVNNRQTLGQTLVFGIGLTRSTIKGNRVRNARRGLLFYGGSENQIVSNHMRGGIVGMVFLSYRAIGAKNVMRRNTIVGNVVIGPTEEGISFDCRGNEPDQWPEHGTLPLVTVKSIVPGSTTDKINLNETGVSTGWSNGYYAVVLTGSMTGYMAKIVSSASGSITIERTANSISRLTAGSRILITTGALSNTISGNIVSGAGTYGIALYGSAWHNTVANNSVTDCNVVGIGVLSVVDNVIPGVQSWSGCNTVMGNETGNITNSLGTGDVGIHVGTHAFGGAPFPLANNHNPAQLVMGNRDNGNGIRIDDTTRCVVRNNFISSGALVVTNNVNLTAVENFMGNGAA